MKFKHYIWDFDGTIFNSYPHSCEVFWNILGEENLREGRTKEEVMLYLQLSFADARKFTKISDEGYARFLRIVHLLGDEETLPVVVPFDDCEKVLRAVIKNGGKNYIYTHRNETVHWYLEKFGVADCFSDYVIENDGFPMKPAPDAINAIVERNGLDPDECIMIGDREIDGLSGKNAGIASALVNYPHSLPDGRDPAEASVLDYTAKSLTEFALMMGIDL